MYGICICGHEDMEHCSGVVFEHYSRIPIIDRCQRHDCDCDEYADKNAALASLSVVDAQRRWAERVRNMTRHAMTKRKTIMGLYVTKCTCGFIYSDGTDAEAIRVATDHMRQVRATVGLGGTYHG